MIHVPAIRVETPVTTNGAGDASTAGLLYGIAHRRRGGRLRSAGRGVRRRLGRRAAHNTRRGGLAGAGHRRLRQTTTGPGLILLPSNQPADRFYRGGAQIAAFRSEPDQGPRTPEDWVASTTTVRGHRTLGRSRLPDGSLLVDAIERRPRDWLGPEHVETYGSDTKLLVKLLDSGQRLPIHAHPDAAFAALHLGERHGKAEAWYILTPGEVFLGLVEDIALPRLRAMVEEQDIEGMLRRMHRVPVRPHQTVYVPPGVLHAIGQGILLAEVQEPEDLSILLEWRDFEIDGRADGHLGLGFDTALQAVEIRARTTDEVAHLIREDPGHGNVLAPDAAEFFRLESVVRRRRDPRLRRLRGLDHRRRLGDGHLSGWKHRSPRAVARRFSRLTRPVNADLRARPRAGRPPAPAVMPSRRRPLTAFVTVHRYRAL